MKRSAIFDAKSQKGIMLTSACYNCFKTFCLFTFIFCLALCSAPSAFSQTPQGFTYQALAMNASGEPIRNQALPVRITIQSEAGGGTIFLSELHSAVTTNNSGMFTLVVGTGVKQFGTADSFADIDWSIIPKYIKTEIEFGGWQDMGASQLWSVPYSMTAGDIAGSLKKLEVAGETTSLDEALFEVKNKNGQTVFAVYNEGVRVYVGDGSDKAVKGGFAIGTFDESKAAPVDLFVVNRDSVRVYIYDDPLNKAVKGGFAIGGFDESKGITSDYLLISPDSIRMYIDKDPTKAVKGGFAIGGFDESKGPGQQYLVVSSDSVRVYIDKDTGKAVKGGFAIGGFDESKTFDRSFFDISPAATTVINPGEERILWYPQKNSFLAGRVLIENPANVGENSMSMGYETRASGNYSQAFGFRSQALGTYSTALGREALAQNANSFAFGQYAQAKNNESYAFGRGAIAEGLRSFAFGSEGVDSAGTATGVAYAKGDYSFAIGQGSQAIGNGAFAIGLADTARGDYSLAMGYRTSASEYFSSAFGRYTKASGYSSTAMGAATKASGISSTAMGNGTKASGYSSTAMGSHSEASGDWSVAMGHACVAIGVASFAMGEKTLANGYSSVALGYETVASGHASTALGMYTNSSGEKSVTIGENIASPSGNEIVIGRFNTAYEPTSQYQWISDDRLFVVGNGTSDLNRSNAMTIMKNGKIALGNINPTVLLDIDGQIRIRGGNPGPNKVLTSNAEGEGAWSLLDLAYTSGVLSVEKGGTGAPSLAPNKLLVGNGTNAVLTPSNLHWDNTNNRLGIGTTNPAALLHTYSMFTGGGNILFSGLSKSTPGDPPASGSGTRMMWYPDKAAFRAGEVNGLHWDKDSIGKYSVAMGVNTKAKGSSSTALGLETSASGYLSTAIGGYTKASGSYSTAMGYGTNASQDYATAMGSGTNASGYYSTAMGLSSTASGDRSIAMGEETVASGIRSTAMGYQTTASNYSSTAMGSFTNASGTNSFAAGNQTTASAEASTALGGQTTASGIYSTAMGILTSASGYGSTAMGRNAKAVGEYSFAIHLNNTTGTEVPANTFRISGATAIGGNVAWTNYSDIRLKKDIRQLSSEENLKKILQLNGVRFRWTDNDTFLNIGLIAQEVIGVIPESVRYDELNDIYLMEYTALIPLLIEGIKEQQQHIESQNSSIENLQSQINELKLLVNELVNR